MTFKRYLKDKLYALLIFLFNLGITFLIFMAFQIEKAVIWTISLLFILSFASLLFIDFFRKKKFYTKLLFHIEKLDKAYLVLETLEKPQFYEGDLLYQALYEINKSMLENINKIEEQRNSFKEYVEMWIHEVKIPLASLVLALNNHKDESYKKTKIQLKRLEDYVEQVLYYVRSEHAEKDYLIKEVDLSTVIKNIGLKNMDDLLESQIDFKVENISAKVFTDSKWLEFILEQIINNSIKYKRNIDYSYIQISVIEEENKTTLVIKDNGIGIKASDLKQVFDKSFTGENGRERSKSTGMGLFIAKNMCEKLGHKITVESEYKQYTKVSICFFKNKFYEVVK